MKEFLILGNSTELMHIAADDIRYIKPDKDTSNYSTIFLPNNKEILVYMQIGKVFDAIQEYLPLNRKNFTRVGRSLIVNKTYISNINLTKVQITLTNKYTDGFCIGYIMGHSDGKSEKEPLINMGNAQTEDILHAPRPHLEELKNKLEGKKRGEIIKQFIFKQKNNNQRCRS